MEEDQLLREFENPEIDQHHELSDLSIPQISPAASRSISPGFRFCNYERSYETLPDLIDACPNPFYPHEM